MRYSILGFNQSELIKYDIDTTDVLLLDYVQIALSQPSMIKRFENGQPYVWLQHKKILEDLPILKIKERMLTTRLSKLVELGLIECVTIANEKGRGSRSYYTTTINFEALQNDNMTKCKKLPVVERPSAKNCSSNNKLIDDNNIISKDIIYSEKTDDTFLGSAKNKPKKESMYSKCVNLINDFTEDDKLRDMLVIFLNNCLEASKETGRPFYTNNFKGKLNQLKKFDEKDWKEIVFQTVNNGWLGFYELKTSNSKDLHTRINESGAGKYVIRGDKEGLKKAINNGTAKKY